MLEHIRSGHDRFYELFAAVVMPDHGHVLLKPMDAHDLSDVTKGIKGVAARLINQSRGTRGKLWQEECFDRIMRDAGEFDQKLEYIVNNAAKRGLVVDPWDYPALLVICTE